MATEATKTEVGSYFIANYPPFSQWTPEALPRCARRSTRRRSAAGPVGARAAGPVPAHSVLPQALQVLLLPRLHRQERRATSRRYVAALSREIELVSQLPVMGGRPFRFVYFGGGTPSFLSAKQLTSLVDRLRANINWDHAEEVTFECEPGTLSEPKVADAAASWASRGSAWASRTSATRFSRKTAGRTCRREVYKSWDWIQRRRLSQRQHRPDLRHGRRDLGQLERHASARRSSLSPDSVTIYQMELPFNTVYSQGHPGQPRRNARGRLADEAGLGRLRVRRAGRRRLRVSSAYTLVKDKSKVNFSYRDNLWHGSDLLATGVASFGHVSGVHYQNQPEWPRLRRRARSAANCRCAAACGRRRINCSCAR